LVQLAKTQGSAVGIAHLRTETLTVLKAIDVSDYRDLQFVFASELCSINQQFASRFKTKHSPNISGSSQLRAR
jgi:polysaccharide deacetylase 2 family uncharacterized protein YibQ